MEAMLAAEPKVNAAQEKQNLAKEKLSDVAPEPKKAPRKKASTKAKTAPKKKMNSTLFLGLSRRGITLLSIQVKTTMTKNFKEKPRI